MKTYLSLILLFIASVCLADDPPAKQKDGVYVYKVLRLMPGTAFIVGTDTIDFSVLDTVELVQLMQNYDLNKLNPDTVYTTEIKPKSTAVKLWLNSDQYFSGNGTLLQLNPGHNALNIGEYYATSGQYWPYIQPYVLRLAPITSSNYPNEPSRGDVLYDTDLNKPIYSNGTSWQEFGGGGSLDLSSAPDGSVLYNEDGDLGYNDQFFYKKDTSFFINVSKYSAANSVYIYGATSELEPYPLLDFGVGGSTGIEIRSDSVRIQKKLILYNTLRSTSLILDGVNRGILCAEVDGTVTVDTLTQSGFALKEELDLNSIAFHLLTIDGEIAWYSMNKQGIVVPHVGLSNDPVVAFGELQSRAEYNLRFIDMLNKENQKLKAQIDDLEKRLSAIEELLK